MTKNSHGTYAFDELINKDEEFKRLLKQAKVLPEIEMNALKSHGLREGMNILDAACGPGVISCAISENFKNTKVTGTDINDNLLEKAKENANNKELDIEFCHGDIYNLSFLEEFDFIYCRFLFQHLNDPNKALTSLYKALLPGGRVCITDVDDAWLSLYPEVPAFQVLTEKAKKCQAESGGDRLIGRKLRNYLKDAGFADIKVEIVSINSDQIGIKQFIDITTGFKTEIISKDNSDKNEGYLDEITKVIKDKDLFGIVGVFVVSGMKK